jgi:hypothetical protein
MEKVRDLPSRMLVGLNMLSLDAPMVAVTWQWAVSRETGVQLGWIHVLILGGSVWCIYTADRLIDALRLQPGEDPAPQRLFALRHFALLVSISLAMTSTMVLLSLRLLPPPILFNWILLGGCLVTYFLLIHGLRLDSLPVPKEFLVALLFAAGVTVFPFSASRLGWAAFYRPFSGAFLLLFGNAWLISKWEKHLDRGYLQSSIGLEERRELADLVLLTPLLFF